MKIAILADIHANYRALLTAVEHLSYWKPDRVVIAGDIINRGPRPAECLDLIQAKMKQEDWQVIRGNHEDYVIMHANPDAPRSGPALEVHRASYWTYQQLGMDVSSLMAMPLIYEFQAPDNRLVQMCPWITIGHTGWDLP